MKYNTICYRLHNPKIYNKGTKYERKCYEFLAYYTHLNDEEAQAEANRLNSEKPERLPNGSLAHCEDRTYFVSKQELPY